MLKDTKIHKHAKKKIYFHERNKALTLSHIVSFDRKKSHGDRRLPSRFIITSIECFDINTINCVISKYGSKKELILISFDFPKLIKLILKKLYKKCLV